MKFDDLIHAEHFAHCRSPSDAGVGIHLGDTCGGYYCRFLWFDDVNALVDFLLNVHIPLVTPDPEWLEETLAHLNPILETMKSIGLTDSAREGINSCEWGYAVHWWGTLEQLKSGQTTFSREILGSFAVKKGSGTGVMPADLPAFLEFLHTCCEHDFDTEHHLGDDPTPPEGVTDCLRGVSRRH